MGVGNWFSCRETRGERNGKMIRINQIKLTPDKGKEELVQKATKILRISEKEVLSLKIRKQSIDARKKPNIMYVYTVDVEVSNEQKIMRRQKGNQVTLIHETPYDFPNSGTKKMEHRPVVIGSGPAGLFCAYLLAEHGYRPVVYERGASVEERKKDVERFWNEQILNPNSNVQFGEGGAGTFSDGKLNTLVKDTFGRGREVLSRFVEAGAPSEILYQQKPHLGTDQLVGIVQFMRHQIEEMGGEFRFRSTVTDLMIRDRKLTAVIVNAKEEIPAEICILAPGHSARDTFAMLEKHNINMEPKSFAVGVRVEHPQTMINQDLYGEPENDRLGASSYKVTHTLENGRGVYSFCMCPGGYVVNASSEEGMLAVNGMSYQARDSHNANSAIIVTVNPSDFPEEGVLGGIALQRKLERAAWEAGKGKIPVQLFKDYCTHQKSTRLGDVIPCIKGAYTLTDVRSIFPKEIGDSIEAGIHAFGKKLSGFDRPDALLEGVESRTSSPVRIVREPKKLTSNIEGIYPCGEGAGYAGGITSAAMDGIKVAEAVASVYALPVNKM